MFLSLEDISPDLFYNIDDTEILIDVNELQSLPELAKYISLGSFGTDGKVEFFGLSMSSKIETGKLFLLRDRYMIQKDQLNYINTPIFDQEFNTIPKLVQILDKYLPQTGGTAWIQGDPRPLILIQDMLEADLYYLIVLYFSSTYRDRVPTGTGIQSQVSKSYDVLTDIDFELNHYTIMQKVSNFFFYSFKNYLKITPGDIPFQNNIGTILKDVIQTKNTVVRRVTVENEINGFIDAFNNVYSDIINILNISIVNNQTQSGGDAWVVEIMANVDNEMIQFNLVSPT